jgi:hypothetical protein
VNRLVRELGAGNPPAQFDERGVETGHGRDGGTPADERAGQQGKTNFDLNYRATPRLYSFFRWKNELTPIILWKNELTPIILLEK